MGQFSWITKQGRQITIDSTVWMVFKSDRGEKIVLKEDNYDGYGCFDGVDYFVALYHMNKFKIDSGLMCHAVNDDYRNLGIDIEWGNLQVKGAVEYPQLFLHEPTQEEIDNINWKEALEHDPNQGWADDDSDAWWAIDNNDQY